MAGPKKTTTAFMGDDRGDTVAVEVLPAAATGRYAMGARLGEGGMGDVDEATDTVLHREVAIKALKEARAGDPRLRAQFIAEARAQARLEHPSIIPVYDLVAGDDGRPRFAMRKTQGQTLADILAALREEQPATHEHYSQRARLEIFIRVCLALEYAHGRGIVHLDVKPSNIMVGDFGDVYVLDWGGAASSEAGRAMVASPGYTAPEIASDSTAVSPAADIYGLGCLLFELLTLEQRAEHEGVDPSTLRPNIAPELDVVCMRATQTQPDARFASARELATAIEAFLDGVRDDELRKTLSAEHAQAAADLKEDDALSARREAMREVGAALALDPTNEDALRILLDLAESEPAETPKEVEAQVEASSRAANRRVAWAAAAGYLGFLLTAPVFTWVGVLDLQPLLLYYGLTLLAALLAVATSRSGTQQLVVPCFLVSSAAIFATVELFGPLFGTPMFIAINCATFAVVLRGRWVYLAYAVGLGVVLIPPLLQAAGAWAPGYTSRGHDLVILASAISLDLDAILPLALMMNAVTLLLGMLGVRAAYASVRRVERRLFMQTWHIRQIVPAEGAEI